MKGATQFENYVAPNLTYVIADVSRNGAQIAGKDKQHPKSRCWDREEISGNDLFGVIFEKGAPRLRRRLPFSNQVFGYGRLRYLDSELQQFPVDSRCPPPRGDLPGSFV